jgi:hypothetical protein
LIGFVKWCWQQIDLSGFVANELSALADQEEAESVELKLLPDQEASGGPTLPFLW